jgi:RNA polymerase sigma-70 factor (ECF subfamily)
MSETTEELVLAAQGGDDLAVQELFLRYVPRLSRIVRARLGPRLRAHVAVDDILQETFLQAILRLRDFESRGEGAFLDWLSTLGCNQVQKAAEHWSREKRDPGREIPVDGRPADSISERVRELSGRISGPVTRALHAEREALFEQALDGLDEAHREVIVLRNLTGLSFAEIAERMGRQSEPAVRELHRRARAKLAVSLRRKGYVDEEARS